MDAPSVPVAIWIPAAFDPVLIVVAAVLGWKADQFGKLFIAAIAALAVSVLFSALVARTGLPWPAPVGRDMPTLYPVRAVASFLWALAGFGARRAVRR